MLRGKGHENPVELKRKLLIDRKIWKGQYPTMLLVSNEPLAARQRLANPSRASPTGPAWLADPEHLVQGRGRIEYCGRGWIEIEEIETVEPFRFWDGDMTVLAYNPVGPTRQTPERPDQHRFRERVVRAYGGRCAVTGCDALELLDAAHLRSWRIDDVGVLLRTDLHRMIDRGLAEISRGRFRLLKPLSGYQQYDGSKLRSPIALSR